MEVKTQEVMQAPILMVDDSLASLQRLENILEEAGFSNIRKTDQPTEAVKIYGRFCPIVTILDQHMPDMTGVEVFDEIQNTFSQEEIAVLFWTSASRQELLSRALQRGAHDIIRKQQAEPQEIQIRVKNLVKSQLRRKKIKQRKEELSEKIEHRTKELSQTSIEALARLIRAAEFRDNETGGHIKRIGLLAKTLAEKLNLNESIDQALRYAAPMHDIGKIGVPDEILFKPASLNDQEWETMKRHTTFGAEILGNSERPYLKISHNIARHHHENWNGNGYPDGLEKREIPIEARITAVCDVFDAVLSERPYKEPWSTERALELLREERGKKFDPDIVECFLEHADRMIEIREETGDTIENDDLVPDTITSDLFNELIQV